MNALSKFNINLIFKNNLNFQYRWGQVFILNALAEYIPEDTKSAENICERVVSRLNHANSAVVFGAVKVIMSFLDHIDSPVVVKNFCSKISPSLSNFLLNL